MIIRITYITWENRPIFEDASDIFFEEKKELPPLEEIRDAVLIDPSREHEADAIWFLNLLRKNSITFLVPVFFTSVPSNVLEVLGNGIIHTIDEIKSHVVSFKNRQKHIHPANMADMDARLLAHAYVFGNNFQPLLNDLASYHYNFPLAEALADNDTDIFSWLELLRHKGLLTKEILIDRVRVCPKCSSAHLNFLDICPSCNSLRIQKDIFLHCFTCGHVESQSNFIIHGLLQCPQCQTTLRHIGSDYDRAMETYSCKDCASIFAEPHVVARCMKCGIQVELEKLIPLEICPYRLSPKGETVALVGWQEIPVALLDDLNFVTQEYFIYLLSWLTKMYKRYPDAVFSIFGFSFLNLEALAQSVGSVGLSKIMKAFALRLRELLRTTDVVSRTDSNLIWVILPRTSKEGCEQVKKKFRELIADTKQEDGGILEIARVAWTLDSTNSFRDPRILLANLTSLLKTG